MHLTTLKKQQRQHTAPFFSALWLSAGFTPHPTLPPSPLSLPVGAGIIDRPVTAQLPGTLSLFQLERTERKGERKREREKGWAVGMQGKGRETDEKEKEWRKEAEDRWQREDRRKRTRRKQCFQHGLYVIYYIIPPFSHYVSWSLESQLLLPSNMTLLLWKTVPLLLFFNQGHSSLFLYVNLFSNMALSGTLKKTTFPWNLCLSLSFKILCYCSLLSRNADFKICKPSLILTPEFIQHKVFTKRWISVKLRHNLTPFVVVSSEMDRSPSLKIQKKN